MRTERAIKQQLTKFKNEAEKKFSSISALVRGNSWSWYILTEKIKLLEWVLKIRKVKGSGTEKND